MASPVIAVIGAGHMGSSLIIGLIKNGHPASHLWATDSDPEKLAAINKEWQIKTTEDNNLAIAEADIVLFAIKPQLFAQVAKAAQAAVQQKKPLVISIAAGIREEHIQQWLGGHISIVRTMPNTPALIGYGATALYANQYVSAEQRQLADGILRAVGITVWLEQEKQLDAVTALSGSGPAYFFLIIEALQEAGKALGLPADITRTLTLQTALGAAKMATESELDASELRKHVTSPGGTTEKAVLVLEENHIRDIFKLALEAAKIRSQELANLY